VVGIDTLLTASQMTSEHLSGTKLGGPLDLSSFVAVAKN
jgi:hypothetical protein